MKKDILLTESEVVGLRLRSFQDRYAILDNLDVKTEPQVSTYSEIYDSDHSCMIVVLYGTLHMAVNNKLLEVKSNEVLVLTPYVSYEFLESRCIMFCIVVKNEIIEDIYEHSMIGGSVGVRYYTAHHFHIEKYQAEILLNDYHLLRIEQDRNNYNMKEMTLRAFTTAFIAHLYSYAKPETMIYHGDNAKGWSFFEKFLNQLSLYYKKERSVQFYAEKTGISPKYLSAIVIHYTGETASSVIDNYVASRIKQALYSNNTNTKKISDHYNFSNQSFFGRFFKRVTGESPFEYQSKHNRKNII